MEQFETVVRFVIAVLFSGLWQAPLFALAAWLVLRVRSRANATTRHSVLAAALFAALVLPVVTAALTLHQVPDGARATAGVSVPRGGVSALPARTGPSLPVRSREPNLDAGPVFSAPAISRFSLAIPRTVAFALAALWLVGASFVLVRLIISLVHLEGLKRNALPLAVDYREGLTRWAAATAGSHNIRLCTSPEIDIPIAVGLFDAMVLIPERFLAELTPADIDSIVLHELAHLRRADDWFNAVERFAHAFLFFNPGILWLVAQLDLEREVACDDWVLQQNDALPYATCLARVAETTAWPHRAMTAPGAFVTRRGMSIRIERLLSKQRDVRVRTSLGPAGTAVAVLAGLGIVAAFVSPSIAYDVRPAPAAAQPPVAAAVEASAAPRKTAAAPKSVVTQNAVAQQPAAEQKAAAERDAEAQKVAEAQKADGAQKAAATVLTVAPKPAVIPQGHAQPAAQPHALAGIDTAPVAPVPPGPEASVQHALAIAKHFTTIARSFADQGPPPNGSDSARGNSHAAIVAEAGDPDFIDELERAGYTGLSVDQLVQLKAVGVDGDFIRSLKRAGLAHPSVEELVKIRAVGVEPGFIAAMRRHFGDKLDIDSIVGLKVVGVTTGYIAELRARGLQDLSADDVRSLRVMGITPQYIEEIRNAGYPHLSASDLRQLKALGIDGEFIARAVAHGFRNAPVEELVKLKATGVL